MPVQAKKLTSYPNTIISLKDVLGITGIEESLANNIIATQTPITTTTGKVLNTDGTLADDATAGANVKEYYINILSTYYAYGVKVSGKLIVAYYDVNGTFISGQSPTDGIVNDYKLIMPATAVTVKVYGNTTRQNNLTKTSNTFLNKYDFVETVVPQINNKPLYPKSTATLRLCFFGSSWGVNSWWYLNKILYNAGINAELCCFFSSSSKFSDWNTKFLYNTNSVAYTSSNGSDWVLLTPAFKDKISEGWDIIMMQQGASVSRTEAHWINYWEPDMVKIVSNIKRYSPDSSILFNHTWTPAVNSATYMPPYPLTINGQIQWQMDNNSFTKRFAAITGVNIMTACGAMMYALRRSALNNATDFCTDAMHPDDGLPMYALAMTLFQSFAPIMFSKNVDDITWLPEEGVTQASPSPLAFIAVTAEQALVIKNIVKLAYSDLWGFNTL